MESSKKVAVLMPFHKTKMNEFEEISFRNNVYILQKHPIYLLLPEGTNAKKFISIAPNITVKYFRSIYFNTYDGSNLFWLKPEIYDAFKEYQYILKCELDVFVFRDELEYWCSQGYDYIGAPWINNSKRINTINKIFNSQKRFTSYIKKVLSGSMHKQVSFVGNGGFSLRKVFTFRFFSRSLPYIFPDVFREKYQEDIVWSMYLPAYFSYFFKKPDYQKALRFSIETQPQECLKLAGGKLPFGCHGWFKYEPEFWNPYILQEKNV